jgi:hypothetical protein
MSPNRKADLQRKLTLAAIPKPPADLAERIKSDIPKHLAASEAERKRLGSAIAFNMRVAASVLLLVGSLFFAMTILKRAMDEEKHLDAFDRSLKTGAAPTATVAEAPPRRYEPTPALPPPPPQLPPRVARRERVDAAPAPAPKLETSNAEERDAAGRVAEGVAGGVVGGVVGGMPAGAPAVQSQAVPAAPVVAPAPPPPPLPAELADQREGVVKEQIEQRKVAASNAVAARSAVFKAQLEGDAVVSPADPGKVLLRVSLDAIVATHLALDTLFDPNNVVAHRALTPVAADGTSLTAVYELQLKPGLPKNALLATVNGTPIRGGAAAWDDAPLRTRRAALAAAYADARARGADTRALSAKAKDLGLADPPH